MTLSVIIVSYNTRKMTLDSLRALEADLASISSEIWVVDNDSKDGSAEAVRREFPNVHVIESQVNAGFGAANNIAMRQARGSYFLLLNSDAFPLPGAIPALIEYLRAHPRAAVVGPRLLNADDSLQVSCFKFPTPLRAWLENFWISAAFPRHPFIGDYRFWQHDSERNVDFLIGACILLRREVFEQTGGFDERFFLYSEETDWQRRIRDLGWEIALTPAARVIHLGGASGMNDKKNINASFFESLDRYVLKHHGTLGLISFRLAMIAGCAMRAVVWGGLSLLPRLRANASARMLRHLLLTWRQATHWPAPRQDQAQTRAVSA
jgi:GT2 family glycosyltransferase